jgi:hypothetical protein
VLKCGGHVQVLPAVSAITGQARQGVGLHQPGDQEWLCTRDLAGMQVGGMTLEVVGLRYGTATQEPERLLGDYDLVLPGGGLH